MPTSSLEAAPTPARSPGTVVAGPRAEAIPELSLREGSAGATVAGPGPAACFHCGLPCGAQAVFDETREFCCAGCQTVHRLLTENGLGHFYDLVPQAGRRAEGRSRQEQWAYLDDPAVRDRLLDYADARICRVTFHVPAVHCVACVWLLENLFQLHPGLGASRVNFPRRELSLRFDPARARLSEVVALLSSIGYPPTLNLGELDRPRSGGGGARRRLWLQTGLAGFAFGNIMLLSLPAYLGWDSVSGPLLGRVFGFLSLALALPVVVYSAADYWRAALRSFRQKRLTLEVPIALGLAALCAQSAWAIGSGRGEGYLDSLTGLVFFLLCGRAFQRMTHERIAFDRDYRSFFPLAAIRVRDEREETVPLSAVAIGDRLRVRHGELIPSDATLVQGAALIDYSFVTGEAEAVARVPGDRLYAGGRQTGGALEIETVKPVSQSYLTSLWSHATFGKSRETTFDTQTNRYSRQFTLLVLAVAVAALCGWLVRGQSGRALQAFTAVLIVACPCALALVAPFALGTGQRLLARRGVFLRDSAVIETLARVETVVFDKTGTLTAAGASAASATFRGAPLTPDESRWVGALARHSTHPISRRIAAALTAHAEPGGGGVPVIEGFLEVPGAGLAGQAEGHAVLLGSSAWLERHGVRGSASQRPPGSGACLAVDGAWRGVFLTAHEVQPGIDGMVRRLRERHRLALLSGDHEGARGRFEELFGRDVPLQFCQSPLDKLGFIEELQAQGRVVMMVGDGLNDAGALRQSDVGVAVVEQMGAFSPASDVILAATQVPDLGGVLDFARRTTRVVRLGFAVSAAYNAVGLAVAAMGLLSPLICATLMPLSSVSVVWFACAATRQAARGSGGLDRGQSPAMGHMMD